VPGMAAGAGKTKIKQQVEKLSVVIVVMS